MTTPEMTREMLMKNQALTSGMTGAMDRDMMTQTQTQTQEMTMDTAKNFATMIVDQMSDDDKALIHQQGTAEAWSDGIGMMMAGDELYESRDVVREIEDLLHISQ